jgi:DNA polymerase-3 subunit delta
MKEGFSVDYKQAALEWSKGKVRPVYVLVGGETFLKREWMEQLVHAFLAPDERELALSRYDLTESSLDQVLDDVRTPPFLASKKIVIASGATFLTGARDHAKIEHQPELLIEYVEQPTDDAILVLEVESDKLDERKKVVKTLKQSAIVLNFATLGSLELKSWLEQRAKKLNVTFADHAVEIFISRVGHQCATLASELEKLSLYVGNKGTIHEETIDALTIRTSEHNVFLLVEEITLLRTERAITLLDDLLRDKEEPIKIVMLIARQFRILLGALQLVKQGSSPMHIASQLGIPLFAAKAAIEQAKHWKLANLLDVMNQLAELDVAMKSGTRDKRLGIELFILKLGTVQI